MPGSAEIACDRARHFAQFGHAEKVLHTAQFGHAEKELHTAQIDCGRHRASMPVIDKRRRYRVEHG